jgi:tetratricopeptide (TPR) repeat protein
MAYRRLGQHDIAVEYHKKAIELNPKFGHGYYSLGLARFDRREYGEARDAFLRAVQFNWAKGTSYYNLGLVYQTLKDYPNAEASYLKAIQFGYNSDGTYYALGFTYFERGNYSEALAAFKEAKKINPELPGINSQIERCYPFLRKPLLDRIAFWKE